MKILEKKKRIVCFILFIALVVTAVIPVAAEENNQTSGSVVYKTCNKYGTGWFNELRDYIDSDGAYSSQDILRAGKSSEKHKIILEKAGTVVFKPLVSVVGGNVANAVSVKDSVCVSFYESPSSDALFTEQCSMGSNTPIKKQVTLDAGTYYYSVNNSSDEKVVVSTFIGFKANDSVANPYTSNTIHYDEKYTEVGLECVSGAQEFLTKLDSSEIKLVSSDSVTAINSYSPVYKIKVPEDGWILAHAVSDENKDGNSLFSLYSNSSLSSCLSYGDVVNNKSKVLTTAFVKKGTYYYRIEQKGTASESVNTYLGFISNKSRLSLKSTKLTDKKTKMLLKFGYDSNYLGSVKKGKILVVPNYVNTYKLNDSNTWKGALDASSGELSVTKNGWYTAKIVGLADPYVGVVRFKVSGIVKTAAKPGKVTVSSLKSDSKKTVTLKWKKRSDAKGYQISYTTDSKWKKGVKTVNVTGTTAVTRKITGLTSKKKYFVKIRAWNYRVEKEKQYGDWSKVSSVTTK